MKNMVILIVWAVVAVMLCEFDDCSAWCSPFPCDTTDSDPVCGSDGVTYSSYCELTTERDCGQPDLKVQRFGECFTSGQKFGIIFGICMGVMILICCAVAQSRRQKQRASQAVRRAPVSRQHNNAFCSNVFDSRSVSDLSETHSESSYDSSDQTRSHVNADRYSTASSIPTSIWTTDVIHSDSSHNASSSHADRNQRTSGPIPDGRVEAPPQYSDAIRTSTAMTPEVPSQPSALAQEDESLPSYESVISTHSIME